MLAMLASPTRPAPTRTAGAAAASTGAVASPPGRWVGGGGGAVAPSLVGHLRRRRGLEFVAAPAAQPAGQAGRAGEHELRETENDREKARERARVCMAPRLLSFHPLSPTKLPLSQPPGDRPATTAAAAVARPDASVDDDVAASPSPRPRSPRADDPALAALCDSGLPDAEVCELVDLPPADPPILVEAWARGRWLLGLLAVQSTSSFVLEAYADLLRDHLVVSIFLTMLVGAGGNAGNQSAIHVIRGLATGTLTPSARDFARTIAHQAGVGAVLAAGLALGGYGRVALSGGSPLDAAAIGASLFGIVLASVCVGTALPFGLARVGIDPANAGTSVQVAGDVLGVAITCVICTAVLGQAAGALGGG